MTATLKNTFDSSLQPPASFNRRAIGPRAVLPGDFSLTRTRSRHRRTIHLNPPASSLPPPASRRRGVSLLEVLISIFVLTFGLLGIAMVIPAGRALMTDAGKSDRSSACGRAVLNDIQVRGWTNPEEWRHMWGPLAYSPARITTRRAPPPITPEWTVYDIPGGLIYGETFFLDPAFFQSNSGTASVRHFPYSHSGDNPVREFSVWPADPNPRLWPDRALARRISIPMPAVVADRITTWADELIFSLEADNARPRQMGNWLFFDSNNNALLPEASQNGVAPILPGDDFPQNTTTNMVPQIQRSVNEKRYTWSVMITPIVPARADGRWDHDNSNSTPYVPLIDPARITRYEISVVVFYRRNFYCPTDAEIRDAVDAELIRERSVYAQVIGGGTGGGDVLLFVTGDGSGTTSVPANPPNGYLNLRKNDWIMLKALDRSRQVGDGPNVMFTQPAVCKWYRVVGVDDEQVASIPDPNDLSQTLNGRGRYVTLAGPDWQVDTTYDLTVTPPNVPPFRPQTDIAEAALVDDVVGVHTTIIDVNAL